MVYVGQGVTVAGGEVALGEGVRVAGCTVVPVEARPQPNMLMERENMTKHHAIRRISLPGYRILLGCSATAWNDDVSSASHTGRHWVRIDLIAFLHY